MDSHQQEICDEDRGWNFMAFQLMKNIDDFGIIKTQDKFGCDRYYWKCRDDSGGAKCRRACTKLPKNVW